MNLSSPLTPATIALICAAGSGSRAGGDVPKQYQRIGAQPMLAHTISAFQNTSQITSIYVVIAPSDTWYDEIIAPLFGENVRVLRVGGATRAESICYALAELDALYDEAYVMVHDAARPCVTDALIKQLYDEVVAHGGDAGGLLALPVVDTVKSSDDGLLVKKTVERKKLLLAQTPQMFKLHVLFNALSDALVDADSAANITDDASVMERAGYDPLLVHGHVRNLKVTHADDFKLAQFWLNHS
jgi:2-C-methyl-D-erythritol 4-phosphate cytidylyltransferase